MGGSVASDSLRPHGLRGSPRLLCPWDFPDKSIGVGCHFLLQGIFPTQGSNSHLKRCRWIPCHCTTWEVPDPMQLSPVLPCPISCCGTLRSVSAQSPPSSFHVLLLTLESSFAASSGGSCFSACPSHLRTCSL